jgi:YfiH family protein
VVAAGLLDAGPQDADAVFTTEPGRVCAVRTADCLPVLLCDERATCVAAAHAGWRGLAAGVLEATVAALPAPPSRLLAWLGPAIGPAAYEVGHEVRAAFMAADPGCGGCFAPSPRGRWLADLAALARRRLARAGVRRVHGADLCTHADARRFYSYRRDAVTGRMATGAWIRPRA